MSEAAAVQVTKGTPVGGTVFEVDTRVAVNGASGVTTAPSTSPFAQPGWGDPLPR